MGVVYSAHDSVMGRTVAIKVMMTDFEDDPETSARFYREARAAGQLAHPNIITIFDMGEDDGRPFIVMELLEGETLHEYLERPEAADDRKQDRPDDPDLRGASGGRIRAASCIATSSRATCWSGRTAS